MALAANQQTQYDQLIKAGASTSSAMNAAMLVPVQQTATTTPIGTGGSTSIGATNTPVAQTPPSPTPQIATPPAPTTNPAQTTQASNVQTSTQGTQAQGTQPLTFNGSIVDLLNSAGVDSSFANRQQLAQQYGINGYTGTATQNQDLSKKYLAAYNANKGGTVPQSGAQASSALDQYFKDNPAEATQNDPTRSFMDAFAGMNPIEAQLFQQLSGVLSSTQTQQSFTDLYKQEMEAQGIPGLNMELADVKKIMDGTEDDIRSEITNAGGFATESQVQAMTGARNKTLLKQATYLSNVLQAKNDYVDHIVSLTQADRKQVSDDLDRKLGITKTLFDMSQSMTNAARDNYKTIVGSVGLNGLAELYKDNPAGMRAAEKIMGLPTGSLANEAFLANSLKSDNKMQFVPGTENQASGYFDPKTGKFTSYGGSGGGAVAGGTNALNSNPVLKQAITTILGSGTFTKQQQQNIVSAINSGGDPLTVVKNQAKNIMGQTLATNLSNNEKAYSAMNSLNTALKSYYSLGGKTDIFTGTYENAVAKVGEVQDPKLRSLATQIESALQIYRNAVSGTAYSVQEGKAIANIFPGINKTQGLNDAIIQGRMSAFDSVINDSYAQVLGPQTWQQMQQFDTKPKAPTPDSAVKTGTTPDGVFVYLMPNGTIQDILGNQYDQNGKKIK